MSLVSCPISLFPATSEREKISFHQLHKQSGNRIKYQKVDAETGREVEADDIIKGYEVSKGEYIELEPEELEAVALESKRVIEIDEFVPKADIDELYLNNLYYNEDALKELLKKKQKGEKIERPAENKPSNVVDLMEALRQSVGAEKAGGDRRESSSHGRTHRRAAKKSGRTAPRHRKAS